MGCGVGGLAFRLKGVQSIYIGCKQYPIVKAKVIDETLIFDIVVFVFIGPAQPEGIGIGNGIRFWNICIGN